MEEYMIIEQIYTGNAYRNYNYLIACDETGEALAIDPLESELCLNSAKKHGWNITQVLNTHEHMDHIGGNDAVIGETGAKLLAHAGAKDLISGIDIGLIAGNSITVGKTVELEVLDTPGHTKSHVCVLAHTEQPALFCGDTLFNAGAGNCHGGGHPELLFNTFAEQLSKLSDLTRIYPGHDYIENNLGFTLDREPDNSHASKLLGKIRSQDPDRPLVTTLALEKEVNTFFRLHNPTIIGKLRERFPDLSEKPSSMEVFVKLRELRNSW